MENDILTVKKEDSILPDGEREYLVFPNKRLVPGSIREGDDFFEMNLDTEGLTSAISLFKGQSPDRYRFLIACADFEGLRKKYSFSLDPENIMYDPALTPKIRQRDGVRHDGSVFTDEYKALIASILAPVYKYGDYLSGGSDLYKKNKVLIDIAPLDSTEEITDRLKKALFALEGKLAKDSILIDRRKYRVMMTLMIVFVCLFGAVTAYSAKYYMVDIAAKDTAIDISNAYIARDYIGVLNAVGEKDLSQLSKEERYMSAYAGASVAVLNDKQRAAVMHAITLNTDSLYLDYWIDIGLGEYEDSLDISRRIGDKELELYALVIYRDAVSIDMNITGAEKTDMLKTLDDQINALEKLVSELSASGNEGGNNE